MPAEPSAETSLDTFEPPLEPAPSPPVEIEPPATVTPERGFAARVPPPEPERPRPTVRRAIFFDVENSSRAEHVDRVLTHLGLRERDRGTRLLAIGNWAVVGQETARLLAGSGAELIHSAPAFGVKDWTDLRIAVAAGMWLGDARPGDVLEIITDDQAFDAVGDVAVGRGIRFHRLSYRGLVAAGRIEVAASARRRRSRRGRRRRQ